MYIVYQIYETIDTMNLRYCETDIVYFFFYFNVVEIYAKLLCVGRGYINLIDAVAILRHGIEEAITLENHGERGVLPFLYSRVEFYHKGLQASIDDIND